MNPLGQRILAEIQAAQLSVSDRRELIAAISDHRGHRGPNAKWDGELDFLGDLCEWASELTVDDLPPQEGLAARDFGVSRRTISRYLEKAEIPGWEGFLRFWSLATRGD